MQTPGELFPIYLISTITVLTIIIFYYFNDSFSYFHKRKIPYLKPTFPIGNTNFNFYHRYGQELQKIYQKFKNKGVKYGGFYLITKPVFFPLDPELLKKILSKDFQYFNIRGVYYNEKREFITANLFALGGWKWKKLRTKFSSNFSTSKLKNMVEIMLQNIDILDDKLNELTKSPGHFNSKDLATRITTDMFCSVGFGIESNSLTNSDAEFFKCAQSFVKNNIYHTIKLALAVQVPKFFDKLHIYFVKAEFQNFFIRAIKDIVEYREKNSVTRNDFMNSLLELKNSPGKDEALTLKQLIAQCLTFFIGGFDTSSSTMHYCLFELTQNQELQDELRKEIRTTFEKNNGQLTYEAITKMSLLDKVISETLRKYPPVPVLNRICTQDYTIPNTEIVIEKDTSVMISVLGLHYDPEYYPDPEKFDPERFSETEIARRHPYTYLPFGEGPRICIGMRLGLLQSKIGIIYLLKNHRYSLNHKTILPLKFKTESVLLSTDGDIWINVEKI